MHGVGKWPAQNSSIKEIKSLSRNGLAVFNDERPCNMMLFFHHRKVFTCIGPSFPGIDALARSQESSSRYL